MSGGGPIDTGTAYRIIHQMQAMQIWGPSDAARSEKFNQAFEMIAELQPKKRNGVIAGGGSRPSQ
jgi:hypothetical protein